MSADAAEAERDQAAIKLGEHVVALAKAEERADAAAARVAALEDERDAARMHESAALVDLDAHKALIRPIAAERDRAIGEAAATRAALAFARSVIQSGERWTADCERTIGRALAPGVGERAARVIAAARAWRAASARLKGLQGAKQDVARAAMDAFFAAVDALAAAVDVLDAPAKEGDGDGG